MRTKILAEDRVKRCNELQKISIEIKAKKNDQSEKNNTMRI